MEDMIKEENILKVKDYIEHLDHKNHDSIANFDMFIGMLAGIIAQDFDVTHIFIDSVFKSVTGESMENIDTLIIYLFFDNFTFIYFINDIFS